jgi:serine/threonine-protein kinase
LPALAPGTDIDRYTVEAQLGEGGIAVVYRVRHTRLQTPHAMKVLKVRHDAIADRLLQEGRIQARLQHPNIVSVTDVVDVDGSPGLVMEYVDGSNLEQLLLDRRLSFEQADHLARGILQGARAAHGVGLIHRDLKPANILLAVKGSEMIPKITDFGLAKLLAETPGIGAGEGGSNSGLTRSGVAMGTPSYMAPEQIRSAADVDVRADVFSLGAILYELVTGQRAYDSDDLLALFNAIAHGRRTPLTDLVPDIPRRMQRAIDGALRVDADDRIPTTDALLQVWTGEVLPEVTKGPFNTELFDRVRMLGSGLEVDPEVEEQVDRAEEPAFEDMETPRDPSGPLGLAAADIEAASSEPDVDGPPEDDVSPDDATFPFDLPSSGPPKVGADAPSEGGPSGDASSADALPGVEPVAPVPSTSDAPPDDPNRTVVPDDDTSIAPESDERELEADHETEVRPLQGALDDDLPPSARPTVVQPRGPRTARVAPPSTEDAPPARGWSRAFVVGGVLLLLLLFAGLGAALIGGGVLASLVGAR